MTTMKAPFINIIREDEEIFGDWDHTFFAQVISIGSAPL